MRCVLFCLEVCCWATLILSDEYCESNADCKTGNNPVMDGHSYCRIDYVNCKKGKCNCAQFYSSVGNKCLKDVDVGAPCNASYHCMYETTCQNKKCACANNHTFNNNMKLCLPVGKSEINGQCSTLSDCYEKINNTVECNGGYCRCKKGYITENFKCRLPHLDERCEQGLGCETVLTEEKQTREECSLQGICACPDLAETFLVKDTGKNVCLWKNLRNDGEKCEAHNQCFSGLCRKCPGDSHTTCVRSASAFPKMAGVLTSVPIVAFLLPIMRNLY